MKKKLWKKKNWRVKKILNYIQKYKTKNKINLKQFMVHAI